MAWIAILCVVASMLLILLETMVPSMGLLTILSAVSLVTAYIIGFKVDSTLGWSLVGTTIVVLPLMIFLGVRLLPKTPWGRRMIVAGTTFSAEEGIAVDRGREAFMGKEGIAYANLRPCGLVTFGEHQVSCMSRGEMIHRGTRVRVIAVDENRVLVEAVDGGEGDEEI